MCVVVLGSLQLIICVFSGETFKAVLARMSQLASAGATELRVRSLDAISQLLTLQVCVCVCVCVNKEHLFVVLKSHFLLEEKCLLNV